MRGGALRQIDRRRRTDSKRSVGPPRRGRVHSQEGAADQARGGIGCKPVSPRSGAPKARLAAKEETRQAAQALLASVNAPGLTRSDPRRARILSNRRPFPALDAVAGR